jgi:hypothetical protein
MASRMQSFPLSSRTQKQNEHGQITAWQVHRPVAPGSSPSTYNPYTCTSGTLLGWTSCAEPHTVSTLRSMRTLTHGLSAAQPTNKLMPKTQLPTPTQLVRQCMPQHAPNSTARSLTLTANAPTAKKLTACYTVTASQVNRPAAPSSSPRPLNTCTSELFTPPLLGSNTNRHCTPSTEWGFTYRTQGGCAVESSPVQSS